MEGGGERGEGRGRRGRGEVHGGFRAVKFFWEVGNMLIRSVCFIRSMTYTKIPLHHRPQPAHIPLPIPPHPHSYLTHLLATAQAPISRFCTCPDMGEMSKSKISIGKPNVMHAFGI